MTKQELELKVINATTAVQKREAVIQKHRAALERLIAKGADAYDISYKRDEIKGAERKLEEAKQILKNWEAKLGDYVSRDAFIEANAPQVIKDFLEQWKARVIQYYTGRFEEFCALKEQLREEEYAARLEAWKTMPEYERSRRIHEEYRKGEEPTRSDLLNLYPSAPVEKLLKERGLDWKSVHEKLNKAGDGIIFRMEAIHDEQERQAWLEKTTEEEKKAKLVDMICRITRVVGTITDAANLRIGAKGDINGIITGTEGRAKVETIGAGGYNIVCYHFRTLVHEYKGGGGA